METIGDRIKLKRKELGLTQLELAEKLKVTDRAVSKWEQNDGNPDLSLIPSICETLGISTDYLLLGKEDDSISLDDMDECKRLSYLIKKDDDKSFIKYGYQRSLFTGNTERIERKSVSRLDLKVWEEILDAKAKKIFSICWEEFVQATDGISVSSILLRGVIDKLLIFAFDLDKVEVLEKLNVRSFAIGQDKKYVGYLNDNKVVFNANSGISMSAYQTGEYATKMSFETLEYMFLNAEKSPKCFLYITSFDSPQKTQYGEVKVDFSYLDYNLLNLALEHKNLDVFNRIFEMYKEYAELCTYETRDGIFYKFDGKYVMHSGGYYPIGKLYSFSEGNIQKIILWDRPELVKECLEFNKLIIKKITCIDGKFHDKSNRGIFLMTEPEIERFYKLNNNKISKEDRFMLECVNNHIIVPSVISASRDLKLIRQILDNNYFNYFEFAFDAITNGKEKEFFKFLVDSEFDSLACKLMMNETYDPGHKEFLRTCWNFFNNYSSSKILMTQNKILSSSYDANRRATVYPDEKQYNEWIWVNVLKERGHFVATHTNDEKIDECICSLKDNKIIAWIKEQKDAIYNWVVERIEAEKKAEQDRLERQKIVKGLNREYFEKLLSNDGKELFIIKLCALFDAILRFDFSIDGEDLSERMKTYFANLESQLPQPRTCDDGWGYQVDDTEWFESTVKPAREKLEHLKNLMHRLRMQRNNISHSETHDVDELSDKDLKECLEYVFSINKVEA